MHSGLAGLGLFWRLQGRTHSRVSPDPYGLPALLPLRLRITLTPSSLWL